MNTTSTQTSQTRRWPWLMLPVLAAMVATVTISGQQAPPPTSSAQTTTQRPTFVSQIDAVTLDVIVRDKRGQFLPDLKREDFIVLEDGVPQELLEPYLIYGGRQLSAAAPVAVAAPEGMILPPSRPVADVAGRVFVIFIDDLHLQAADSPKVRQLLTQITNTLVHDGDLFAVVSTGPSSIEVNPTYDRSRITESIKKVMGNGMSPEDILLAPASTSGPQEIRHRVHVAFSTAYDLLRQFEKINNRRKAFIYLSSGYDFNPFTESRWKQEQERYSMPSKDENNGGTGNDNSNSNSGNAGINPFETGSQAFAIADLVSQLAELTRAANRANATFYTIDPRGLVAGPDINQTVTTTEWRNYVNTSVDSLKTIADLTGGFCICNSNDFKRGLERIDSETSDYYILGYNSSNPDPLRRVRKIEVKVKRDDVTVTHRSQWTLPVGRRR
jgi:VWFA-related protein